MRVHARTAAALLLAAALIAVFVRQADLSRVGDEIRGADPRLLVAGFGVTATTYLLRALRWRYLLRPIGPTRLGSAFQATVIGFAATFLLPARAGELLRPYFLARWEHLSPTAAFATIILERLLDLLTVLLLLGLFLALFDPGMAAVDPTVFGAVMAGGLAAAAGAGFALILVFVLAGHPEALGRSVARLERLLPGRLAHWLGGLIRTFVQGLAVMRQPRRLLVATLLSAPLWISIAGGIWLVTRAFRITVPFTGSFLLMSLLVVGVAIPTPGAVGGFHEAYRIGATAFYAAPNDRAVGAAIVLHAISFVPVTLAGIAFMTHRGLSLGSLRRLAAETDGPLTEPAAPASAPPAGPPDAGLGDAGERGSA